MRDSCAGHRFVADSRCDEQQQGNRYNRRRAACEFAEGA